MKIKLRARYNVAREIEINSPGELVEISMDEASVLVVGQTESLEAKLKRQGEILARLVDHIAQSPQHALELTGVHGWLLP